MNILYAMIYAPEKGGSGAPIYTHSIMSAMSARGHKAGIAYSVHHSYKNTISLPYALHPLYFDHPPIFDNQPKATGSKPFADMSQKEVTTYINTFTRAFDTLIDANGYSMIHVQHGMYIGYSASLIKRKRGIPYMISLHAMELNFLHEFPDPLFAMKAMVDADCIFALSQAQKNRLITEYTKERIIELEIIQNKCSYKEACKRYGEIVGEQKINPERIIVCPLGIDTALYSLTDDVKIDELSIPVEKKIVLYAGRLIEMKGIRYLLEARKHYNERNDTETIVLGGGELEEYVKEQAAIYPDIHFLGFKEQKDMPRYLNYLGRRQGIFCVPSSSEGMSLVVLEAMACGARVVASAIGDMGEMDFMQSPYAQFSEFGHPQKLATTIQKVFGECPPTRDDIRSNMIKYNIQNMVDRIHQTYMTIYLYYYKFATTYENHSDFFRAAHFDRSPYGAF